MGLLTDAGPLEAVSLGIAGGGFALVFVLVLLLSLKSNPGGNEQVNKAGDAIRDGSKSFFASHYKYLFQLLVIYGINFLVYSIRSPSSDLTDGLRIGGCFLAGALLSALSSYMGVAISTDSNIRTSQAAETDGVSKALKVAFTASAVYGFVAAGFALLGLSVMFFLSTLGRTDDITPTQGADLGMELLVGFGLGCSIMSMFAHIQGSIFAKSSDLGAALVKNEMDGGAQNPVAVAERVGVHIGDVGGNGGDLFETFVLAIIAAGTMANGDITLIALPFWLAGAGVVSSAVGFFFVSVGNDASKYSVLYGLYRGKLVAAIIFSTLATVIVSLLFDSIGSGWGILSCIILGQVFGLFVGQITEAFTVSSCISKSVANGGATGPVTLVLKALAYGFFSCIAPAVLIVALALSTIYLSGAYGVGIAAVSMLSNFALILATDTCAPVSSNVASITATAGLEDAYEAAAVLESAGITIASGGKGYAVSSSVLTSVSVLTAFKVTVGLTSVDTNAPTVLAGLLIGVWFPFFIASIILFSINRAAESMLIEARQQLEGIAESNSSSCVDVAIKRSFQEMILPSLFGCMLPFIVGYLFGPLALAGMLTGSIATSMMLNITLVNTGTILDGALNYTGIDGNGRASIAFRTCEMGSQLGAAVSAVGPVLNSLIKLMSIIALALGPFMTSWEEWGLWYYGFIPVGICIVMPVLVYLYVWKDAEEVVSRRDASQV